MKKININNCTSLISDKKNKPKYINNYDLNKSSNKNSHKTLIKNHLMISENIIIEIED